MTVVPLIYVVFRSGAVDSNTDTRGERRLVARENVVRSHGHEPDPRGFGDVVGESVGVGPFEQSVSEPIGCVDDKVAFNSVVVTREHCEPGANTRHGVVGIQRRPRQPPS